MFWSIAWRNIWAKKRSSLLTIALSVFCTVFLIFFLSLMHGQHNKMLQDAIEIYTGYIQVTSKGYEDSPDYDHLIYDSNEILLTLEQFDEIETITARLQSFALLATDEDSVGGMIVGIDAETEKGLSRIESAITDGQYLNIDNKSNCIIGKKLAKRLKLSVGDKFAYLSQALDMSMAADILNVVGIFATGSQLDSNAVFISKAYMDEIFLSDNTNSHFVLLPKKKYQIRRLEKLVSKINMGLQGTEAQANSWRLPLKSMLQMVNVDSVFGYFSYGILVAVIFFVIMIFSLISIFQRTKEIGVLRAVGTKPKEILLMLLGEALILGVIAVLIGGLIGGYLCYYFYINPIEFDVPAEILEQYQQWGVVDMVVPAVFSYFDILMNCLFVLALNLVAVLYPALKVNSYKPVEAINYV